MTTYLRRITHINHTIFQIIFGGEDIASVGPANDNRKPLHLALPVANLVSQARGNKTFIQQYMGTVSKHHRC